MEAKGRRVVQMRGRKAIRTDSSLIKKAAELYRGGATYEEVAEAVDLSTFTVRQRLKDLGIPARKPGRRQVAQERIETIIRKHKSGMTNRQIAKAVGITPPTVRKYIKQAGKQKDGEQD